MKMTRVLAGILCMMMVITIFPAGLVSATGTDGGYATIEEVLGYDIKPVAGQDFQFANNFDSEAANVVTPVGATYDNTNGLSLTAVTAETAKAAWRYKPEDGWTPFAGEPKNVLVFRGKPNTGGTLNVQVAFPVGSAYKRIYMNIKEDDVRISKVGWALVEKEMDFAPGTEWIDYMIKINEDQGYSIYVKGETKTEGKWKLLATVAVADWLNGDAATGMAFYGNDSGNSGTNAGGYVQYATVYQKDTGEVGGGDNEESEDGITTVAGLLGYDVKPVSGQDFQFADSFDAAAAKVVTPTGAVYDNTNGLDMTAITADAANASWRFKPEDGWSPFTGDPKNVLVFRAKVKTGGTVNAQVFFATTTSNNRIYMNIKEDDVRISKVGWALVEKEMAFAPGTDWVDYLIKINDDNGFSIYANSETKTKGKWELLATVANADWLSGSASTGIAFGGNNSENSATNAGGYIQYATVYKKDTGESEDEGGDTPTPPAEGEEDFYEGVQGNASELFGDDAVIIKDFQLGAEFDTTQAGITSPSTGVYTDGMGINMVGKGTDTWRYLPQNEYTPLSSKGVTFGVKLPADGAITYQMQKVGSNTERVYVELFPTQVKIYQSNGEGGFIAATLDNAYTPGTGWNDYLIKGNELGGYDVYAKRPDAETWTKLVSTTSFRPGGGATTGASFYFANGGAYLKYLSIYGSRDEIPEEEGPAPGEQFTMEDIIGGVAVVQEELVFDTSFDGVTENAQLKNVTTGAVAETQPTVGANGLELENTGGLYFAWNSGSENSWKPLKKTNPIMIRAKVESEGSLGIQLNGYPRASISISPDKLIAWGTDQKEAPGFAPGTGWVNYLITSDGTNFRIYSKTDAEEKWTVRVTSNGFRSGGYYGVLLYNTTTSKAYISTVKQYKVDRVVLTDTEAIAAIENKVYIDEDFSEDKGLYNMITGKIEDGVFKRDPSVPSDPTYPDTSRIDIDLGTVNPKGQWYVRYKYRIPTSGSMVTADMQNNGAKIAIDCHATHVYIINRTSGNNITNKLAAAGIGNWAELLFAWTDNSKVSVYWHKVGDDEWIKLTTDFEPGTSGYDDIRLHAKLDGEVDDVKVYSGDYLSMDEPELESGLVKTYGEFFSGTWDTPYDRRATLITVVNDKTYGYAKFVETKEYQARGGNGADLSNTFTATGVGAEDAVSVMLWDTVETGIPLGDAVGNGTPNKATGAPASGTEIGVAATTVYNEVSISGYTGIKNGLVTVSVVDESGNLRAAAQTKSSGTGLLKLDLAVDPACQSGTYTVSVRYGETVEVLEIELYCDDIPYNSISDVASMRSFLGNYGSESVKKWNEDDSFAAEVYARYLVEKGETTTFDSLYAFRSVMDVATNGEVRERELCQKINTAAAADLWADVQTLIMETYAEDLGISSSDIVGISNSKELFLRIGSNNTSTADVLASFRAAITAQKAAESASNIRPGGGGGAGGGGGGGVSVGTGMFQGTVGFEQTDTTDVGNGEFSGMSPIEIPAEFTDLDSVSWAKEAVAELQVMGIVSGDGDGTFAPNRAVTREEFLKMVMQAAEITATDQGSVTFGDVDVNAWYYPYVVAAYQAGIIQGISEEFFGIGQQITRADMAVIVKRILDYHKVEINKIHARFVFDDFSTIPDYARESIDLLCQAGLMNGVGNNKFAGGESATRAESAVAIYRIYNYMAERR